MAKTNMLITIGREFGSGGHEIGKLVAQKLNINFYDRNLIELAAEHSGLDADVVKSSEEKAPSLLSSSYDLTLEDRLYTAQTTVMEQIAEKESCVIVGRCSNVILSRDHLTLDVFIYAPMQTRIKRIMERNSIDSPDAARKEIQRVDKIRRGYYQYYADSRWGDPRDYDLMINTHTIGIDASVDLIISAAKAIFPEE